MSEQEEKRVWNDAIDTVLELLRLHPPHRIGEAAFMRRLINLKGSKNERAADKPKRR
jgi:hypothetical protein